MGIYEHELLVDWGVGSYVISCADPKARDSMIVDVVDQASLTAVPGMLVSLSNRMEQVFANITNVQATVATVDQLLPLMGSVNTNIQNWPVHRTPGASTTALAWQMFVITTRKTGKDISHAIIRSMCISEH